VPSGGDWAKSSERAVTPTRNVHGTLPSATKQSSSLAADARPQEEDHSPNPSTIHLRDLMAGSRLFFLPSTVQAVLGMTVLQHEGGMTKANSYPNSVKSKGSLCRQHLNDGMMNDIRVS